MSIKTVSSREFNQNVSGVKKASAKGPVFITHRGKPAHVLLTIKEYHRLADATGAKKNILEMLAMPGIGSIDFDPPRSSGNSLKIPDFGE
jgi:prevent-host-death family protein